MTMNSRITKKDQLIQMLNEDPFKRVFILDAVRQASRHYMRDDTRENSEYFDANVWQETAKELYELLKK